MKISEVLSDYERKKIEKRLNKFGQLSQSRRPSIPGGQRHTDRKNDYRRKAKHPGREMQEAIEGDVK